MRNIVYEDNHLLVVEKPPNLLTQGDATGDDCLLEQMKRYIGEKYQKPGAVYLGLVHRMDRPVGGLVALARTSKAAARLSEQLRSHAMEREYLAVVQGRTMAKEGTLRNFLLKDEKGGNVLVVPEGTPGSQEAILHFRRLSQEMHEDRTLLHIRLETGRKHQIRVQLAHNGHPIVQDLRYGKGIPGEPIALWGAVLCLFHPTQKERLVFISRPQGKAFEAFSEAVDMVLAQQIQEGEL